MSKYFILLMICAFSFEAQAQKPWGHLGRTKIIKYNTNISPNSFHFFGQKMDMQTVKDPFYKNKSPFFFGHELELQFTAHMSSVWAIRAGQTNGVGYSNKQTRDASFGGLRHYVDTFRVRHIEVSHRFFPRVRLGHIAPVGLYLELAASTHFFKRSEHTVAQESSLPLTKILPAFGVGFGRTWVFGERFLVDAAYNVNVPTTFIGKVRSINPNNQSGFEAYGASLVAWRIRVGLGFLF